MTRTLNHYKESSFPLLFCIPCKRGASPLYNKVTRRDLKKKSKRKNIVIVFLQPLHRQQQKGCGGIKMHCDHQGKTSYGGFLAPTVICSQPGVNNICRAHLKSPIPLKLNVCWVHMASPLSLCFSIPFICYMSC